MNYEQYITNPASTFTVDLNSLQSATLNKHLAEIESIIEKPFPKELHEFYSFSDGMEGKDNNFYISSLSKMFDGFQRHIKDLTPEMIENLEHFKGPFYENIWGEYSTDYSEYPCYDLTTEDGLHYYEFVRRQKLLCYLPSYNRNITIDFYEEEKPYQLYFQIATEPAFLKLNISFEKFISIALHIGFSGSWFLSFMAKEDREKINYTLDLNTIKNDFPDFDLNQLDINN